MRIGLAFRVFFAALFDAAKARRLEKALADQPLKADAKPTPAVEPKPTLPVRPSPRSEALTLLAALQREARFLDIIQEPLSTYSDAQIGAAARDVLRNCAQVLERWFDLKPLSKQDEGSPIEVPSGYDPQKFRLVGNVSGNPPFHGKLAHPGWLATKCDLPAWSGSADAANVVAPMEVEVGTPG